MFTIQTVININIIHECDHHSHCHYHGEDPDAARDPDHLITVDIIAIRIIIIIIITIIMMMIIITIIMMRVGHRMEDVGRLLREVDPHNIGSHLGDIVIL